MKENCQGVGELLGLLVLHSKHDHWLFVPGLRRDSELGWFRGREVMMALSRSKEAHENPSLCSCGYENTDIWPQRRRRQRLALSASIQFSGILVVLGEREHPPRHIFGAEKLRLHSNSLPWPASTTPFFCNLFSRNTCHSQGTQNHNLFLPVFENSGAGGERSHRLDIRVLGSLKRTHPLSNPSFSWLSWSSIFTRTFLYLVQLCKSSWVACPLPAWSERLGKETSLPEALVRSLQSDVLTTGWRPDDKGPESPEEKWFPGQGQQGFYRAGSVPYWSPGLLGMSQGCDRWIRQCHQCVECSGLPWVHSEFLCGLVAGTAPEGLGVHLGGYN